MKTGLYISCVALFLISLAADSAAPITSKEMEIPSVRMTLDDLDNILNPVKDLLAKANANVTTTSINESVTLAYDGDSVRIESWALLANESYVPKLIHSVQYRYLAERGSPIANLTISLQPSYRRVSIEGTDKNQIESISAFLEKEFAKRSNFLSSNLFKMTGAIALMIVGGALIYVRRGENDMVWPANLFGVFLLLSPQVLPWDRWLSGVIVLTGSSSYIDMYINYISVFGVIVSVVGLLIPFVKSNKAMQPTQKSGAADG